MSANLDPNCLEALQYNARADYVPGSFHRVASRCEHCGHVHIYSSASGIVSGPFETYDAPPTGTPLIAD